MTPARPGAAPLKTTPAEARARLVDLLASLEREGTTVMRLVQGSQPRRDWTLYPSEYGVFDRRTRSQFYYHAHAGVSHEAGHFHTVRLFRDRTAHLVAISMAEDGWPRALSTLNLWAIGDAYEPPGALKEYAQRFYIDPARWDRQLVSFVNLVFRAYLPQIQALQDAREQTLQAYRHEHPELDVFEDRSLEILSELRIDPREPDGVAPPGEAPGP